MEGAEQGSGPADGGDGTPASAGIPGVAGDFTWLGEPTRSATGPASLSVSAGAGTDWFIDPGSGQDTLSAPALLSRPVGDFIMSARVEVELASAFDAGALVIWEDERSWGKLAFEVSPQGQPMVVSVVTRGWSDDCNSVPVEGGQVWLRVARMAGTYTFHFSTDGRHWLFVRHFRLSGAEDGGVGFEAQSPTGDGCRARFSEISVTSATLADLRNGS